MLVVPLKVIGIDRCHLFAHGILMRRIYDENAEIGVFKSWVIWFASNNRYFHVEYLGKYLAATRVSFEFSFHLL